MKPQPVPSRWPAALLLAGLAGCSLTTGRGFDECNESADCSGDRVCSRDGFCLPPPEGCGERLGDASDQAYLLGALWSLETPAGEDASERAGLDALALALDEVNGQGGVAGRKFALLVCDTRGDLPGVRARTEWLADKGVLALFPSGSAVTLEAAGVTLSRGILVMSPTATSAAIGDLEDVRGTGTGLVWRTAPSDALQARLLAALLKGQRTVEGALLTGIETVGLGYVNDAYGQGLFASLFESLTTVAPQKEVRAAQYERSGELGSVVDALADAAPDLTVLAGFSSDNARLVAAAQARAPLTRAQGHRWLFTDASKEPGLLADHTVAAALEGSYGTAPAQGRGDVVYQAFASRYQGRYSRDPSQFAFTPHAYDALYLVALAAAAAVGPDVLRPAPVSGERLAAGLTQLTPREGELADAFNVGLAGFASARDAVRSGRRINVSGASGALDFDNARGEAPSDYELWKVEGGAFRFVERQTAP